MSMSASTIMATRPGKSTSGLHPNTWRALVGSPTSRSTSAGSQEALVDDDVLLPVEPGCLEGQPAQLAHLVGLPGRDDEVAGRVLLEHEPHGADVVGGVAPVALGVEVAQRQLLVEVVRDTCHTVGHLARHELEAAPGRLVVEQDARGGVQVVALPIVHGDPVPVHLGHPVGAAGVEGRGLALGGLEHLAEHLRRAGLVEADLGIDQADGVEQPGHAHGRGLAGQDGLREAGLDEGLSRQVVDLGRPVVAQDVDERPLVEQVARHQLELVLDVRDALEVHRARAAHHADDRVALLEQELRQVRAVLAGDARDQCTLRHQGNASPRRSAPSAHVGCRRADGVHRVLPPGRR